MTTSLQLVVGLILCLSNMSGGRSLNEGLKIYKSCFQLLSIIIFHSLREKHEKDTNQTIHFLGQSNFRHQD